MHWYNLNFLINYFALIFFSSWKKNLSISSVFMLTASNIKNLGVMYSYIVLKMIENCCENDRRYIMPLFYYEVYSLVQELWYRFLQPDSLFAASVTDFDHALPIWYPLAQLPLDSLTTYRKFAGFDLHAATFPAPHVIIVFVGFSL